LTAGGIPRGPLAAILAAAVIVSLNVGKLPPALPMLREEFGLDLVAASLLVSFFQLAGMLLGLFGGMLADRFGPRRVMRAGLVLAAAGAALGALATGPAMLLASRAVESGGFILAVLPGPALLARHMPAARLRGVMGLWSAYMPLGMALALALSPLAYHAVGWRPVWWPPIRRDGCRTARSRWCAIRSDRRAPGCSPSRSDATRRSGWASSASCRPSTPRRASRLRSRAC
jgi:MFS family permease